MVITTSVAAREVGLARGRIAEFIAEMALLSLMRDIELRFDINAANAWNAANWHFSIYVSAVYLAIIFIGRRWMEKRHAHNLQRPLFLWNFALAAFSIICLLKLAPNLIHHVATKGITSSSCYNKALYTIPPDSLWGFIFAFSKVAELGDTAFIVLRKKPLNFLHYYHHVTVFVFCWFSLGQGVSMSAPSQWFSTVNSFVHSFMYTYYTLSALGWRIPARVALGITILQLSQMFVGLYINVLCYRTKYSRSYDDPLPCNCNDRVFFWALIMYSSYAILFINFFLQRYVFKGKKAAVASKGDSVPNGVVHLQTN